MEKILLISRNSASFILVILFLSVSNGYSQSKNNLDVFNSLVDQASENIIRSIPDSVKNVNLNLNFGGDYSVFKNMIISSFNNSANFTSAQGKNGLEVYVTLENASVNYSEMFRKSFLGSFYVERNFILKGNFILDSNEQLRSFSYTHKDTVKVSEIHNLENTAYPFTKSEIPPEPFLSNIYEPVIAVGTAAVAIFLFFAIRSK